MRRWQMVSEQNKNPSIIYGSFWSRCLAFAWDYLLIALYLFVLIVLAVIVQTYFPALLGTFYQGALRSQLASFLLVTLPVTLYFVISEASSWHATWGKRRRKLLVVTTGGNNLPLGRSLLRTALKFIPWELAHTSIWQFTYYPDDPSTAATLGILVVWCLVGVNIASLYYSPASQTLYDRLTGTYVISY